MKNIILIIIFMFIATILLSHMGSLESKVDRQTIEICASVAPIRKEEYKNTEWKDFDFYQSCIDNIECTSPVKPCKR